MHARLCRVAAPFLARAPGARVVEILHEPVLVHIQLVDVAGLQGFVAVV